MTDLHSLVASTTAFGCLIGSGAGAGDASGLGLSGLVVPGKGARRRWAMVGGSVLLFVLR